MSNGEQRDPSIFKSRTTYSQNRVEELRHRVSSLRSTDQLPDLTIYTTGSYGRLEASPHSDIDLFFVINKSRNELKEVRVPEIGIISDIIGIGSEMNFPKFSNDGEYLNLLYINDIIGDLGSRADDYNNHFTARMLLMLEGKYIHNDGVYDEILERTIETYFRDYKYHPKDFRPMFMVNDIVRFWKTLCLNYENKRNQQDEATMLKQKVKNFKLKFSRMLTCFGTVAAISAQSDGISAASVREMCSKTPLERLKSVSNTVPSASQFADNAEREYGWFLEMTALSTTELEEYFSDKSNKSSAFERARLFGDAVYGVLSEIDKEHSTLRHLVV